MGIPKFYRYLSERYPLVNEIVTSSEYLPECDYLYLDLNGVIHNATHGNTVQEGLPSEETVAEYVMGYVSHIFKQIKPRKLLFMAVDGVAPRAKLNQQRSRRFRSAIDCEQEKEERGISGVTFDSNCITPGTAFMANVDKILEYFIQKKISEDPLWRKTKVLYSSHSDPGEGEHKIMAFIRGLHTSPDYNRNERHCIYGLDADLILLSLSLHDTNIIQLREIISFLTFMKNENVEDRATSKSKWQILHVSTLREYLFYDLSPSDASWITGQNRERLLDDYVAIMILMGDDFLPELPSLDINEGSVQFVVDTYKTVISSMHAFLIEDAKVVIPVFKALLKHISEAEEHIYEQRIERVNNQKVKRGRQSSPPDLHPENAIPGGLPIIKSEVYMQKVLGNDYNDFHKVYYFSKLNLRLPDNKDILTDICRCYYEGIQWVLAYYYRGVCSWSWFYPYHYAPYASDLVNYDMKDVTFNLDEPFPPFLQQLGCLPPQSSAILPPSYRPLVLDPSSPIYSFYPSTFAIDMNGKVNPWEGVNLIPFTDADQMRQAIEDYKCDEHLTPAERKRNQFRPPRLYSYSLKQTKPVRFPFSTTLFPTIKHNHCSSIVSPIPAPQAAQETILHLNPLEGTMCIKLTKESTQLMKLGIVNTGRNSKQPTVTITVPSRITESDLSTSVLQAIAKNCSQCLVMYPYGMHRYAWVRALYTRTQYVLTHPNKKGIFHVKNIADEMREHINSSFDRIIMYSLHGKANIINLGGIDIQDCPLLAELIPIVGIKHYIQNNIVTYNYSSDHLLYPLQLCTPISALPSSITRLASIPFTQRLLPSMPCVYLGTNRVDSINLQGAIGTCYKNQEDEVVIQLQHTVCGVDSGHYALRACKEKWYSFDDLRVFLKIPVHGIIYITGYYRVMQQGERKGNIGLGFYDHDRVIPKYCQCNVYESISYYDQYHMPLPSAPLAVNMDSFNKKSMNFHDMYFSSEALRILMEYKRQFPSLFNNIREYDVSSDFSDLFKNEMEFKNVMNFIESLPYHNDTTMDYHSRCALELSADSLQQTGTLVSQENNDHKYTIKCVPCLIAFWEHTSIDETMGEMMKIVPAIGDRMVVIGGDDIPFGKCGYVIAVHPSTHMVEVVMDQPFIGGTTLQGLLKVKGRGGVIEWRNCLFLNDRAKHIGKGRLM